MGICHSTRSFDAPSTAKKSLSSSSAMMQATLENSPSEEKQRGGGPQKERHHHRQQEQIDLTDKVDPSEESPPYHKQFSSFDEFVSSFPSPKPPKKCLERLAQDLCNEAGLPPSTAVSQNSIDPDSSSGCHTSDGICRVVWEGIAVDWFHSVFMQTAEMKVFSNFGCRMWFLRNFGIQEILLRRGGKPGPLIDQLHLFEENDAGAEGANASKSKATTFISFTGSYSIEHFASLLRHDHLVKHHVWIDSFCVDQFEWTERKDEKMIAFKEGFMFRLREKIGGIERTALMLDSWDHLMSTLGQIWVIWEMFLTADTNTDLVVLLHPNEQHRFQTECFDSKNDIGKY